MKRRAFLALGGGLAASATMAWWLRYSMRDRRPAVLLLLDLAEQRADLARAGQQWLDAHPEIDPSAALLASLGPFPEQLTPPDQFMARVEATIAAEQAAGRQFPAPDGPITEFEARLGALHLKQARGQITPP